MTCVTESEAQSEIKCTKIASNIADECKKHVNPKTICRIIRRAGYNGRVAKRKPLINERNRKIRLQFAREHHLKQERWWHDVIFCDESKFNSLRIQWENYGLAKA